VERTYNYCYLIDLLIVVVGYAYTLRATDTHIRSSEPTVLGWVVALLCYDPFWPFFYDHYLGYRGPGWMQNFAGHPLMLTLWGGAILALTIIYALATIAFGMRFSNLTYRGLITSALTASPSIPLT